MKTRQQIIDDTLEYWFDKCASHWYDRSDPDFGDFWGELIEKDVASILFDDRPCRYVCEAVAQRLNDGEWADWLYCVMDEERERSDPMAYYGLSESDFA